MKELNKRSLDNLKGVHPLMVKLMHEAIKDCPIPFTITEGVRTESRQKQLYEQRTANGKRLTYCDGVINKSNHQAKADGYGYAVDLYAEPINVNDIVNIKVIADHIKAIANRLNINIEWGGDWKMRDYPHFELKL